MASTVSLVLTAASAPPPRQARPPRMRRISAEAAEQARYFVPQGSPSEARRQLARCRRSFECRERNFVTSMRFGLSFLFLASDYPHAT